MAEPIHTVVGAGPSGLAAAITLARAGEPVRVFERHSKVASRFHGDMQGLENWSSRQDILERLRLLGIHTDFPHRGFHEVTFYDSKLRATTAHTDQPLFYLVRRGPAAGTLDSALLRQAQQTGVDVRFDTAARTASRGTIVATGPRQADGIVSGFVFPTSLADQAHAIVHPGLAPGGYAYLLVWDGMATLASCQFRDLTHWRQARDATVAAFQELVPGLDLGRARPFGGYGAVLLRPRYTDRTGRLYVGEAAGLQDAEWGFGMVTALRSGVLAARSLLDDTEFATFARSEFGRARAAGVVNRGVFETLPAGLYDPALRHEASRPDLRERLRRHWAPNRAKSLLAPGLMRHYERRAQPIDTACEEPDCTCIRCACAHEAAARAC